jgi:outer membrane protein assembly factor BamD (BamD/ComL family)
MILSVVVAAGSVSHARAEETYEEAGKAHSWFSFSRPAKKNPADQMAHAEELLRNERVKKAGKAFHALVVTWPGSAEAPMAQWAYARILDQRGQDLDAFDEYDTLLKDYPGRFPDYETILARQFEIATNLMYKKKAAFLFFPGFEAPERAIPLLEKIVENGPRSKFAPEAQYLIGVAYEDSFQNELAVVAYSATLHRYPLSPFAERAAFGRAQALHRISTDYPNDMKAMDEAWAGVMVFLRSFPESDKQDEAMAIRDELLARRAKTAYNVAYFYDKKARRPKAALESYKMFVEQYPKSEWTDEARARIADLAARHTDTKETSNE